MPIRLSALLALAIVATFPAAAAETPSTLNAAGLASIKSIGVISAVGDALNINTNGPFLGFSQTLNIQPISDMGIDDHLETFVGQKLSTRFKIESVQYDRTQFSKVEDRFLNGLFSSVSLPPLDKLVKTLSTPVDAYLIISKDLVPFWLNERILRPGLNIGRGGFHENQYVADAFITVSLIDARTYVVLAKTAYPPPVSRFWGGQGERLPFDGALWPDDTGNFTQPRHDELKKLFTADLDEIVNKSMEQLGLLPALPQ